MERLVQEYSQQLTAMLERVRQGKPREKVIKQDELPAFFTTFEAHRAKVVDDCAKLAMSFSAPPYVEEEARPLMQQFNLTVLNLVMHALSLGDETGSLLRQSVLQHTAAVVAAAYTFESNVMSGAALPMYSAMVFTVCEDPNALPKDNYHAAGATINSVRLVCKDSVQELKEALDDCMHVFEDNEDFSDDEDDEEEEEGDGDEDDDENDEDEDGSGHPDVVTYSKGLFGDGEPDETRLWTEEEAIVVRHVLNMTKGVERLVRKCSQHLQSDDHSLAHNDPEVVPLLAHLCELCKRLPELCDNLVQSAYTPLDPAEVSAASEALQNTSNEVLKSMNKVLNLDGSAPNWPLHMEGRMAARFAKLSIDVDSL
eukprot:m.185612 g.185612  ORF g.185612 m.185612 type:complete len:369 (-) comp17503_c2_seq1:3744-4850(-)